MEDLLHRRIGLDNSEENVERGRCSLHRILDWTVRVQRDHHLRRFQEGAFRELLSESLPPYSVRVCECSEVTGALAPWDRRQAGSYRAICSRGIHTLNLRARSTAESSGIARAFRGHIDAFRCGLGVPKV